MEKFFSRKGAKDNAKSAKKSKWKFLALFASFFAPLREKRREL